MNNRVTDIIRKIIELSKVASTVDGSTKTGRTQLYQLSNRVKDYSNTLISIVLSTIYEVDYEVDGKRYTARLTNINPSEAKGVIMAHWSSRGYKGKINFLEIKRIPTYFSEG